MNRIELEQKLNECRESLLATFGELNDEELDALALPVNTTHRTIGPLSIISFIWPSSKEISTP